MTIASAQGLTVDRAFLLVDDRPARETIYPAATRHREALDVYVNRPSIALDISEHRSCAPGRSGWTATNACCGRHARSSTIPRPTARISTVRSRLQIDNGHLELT